MTKRQATILREMLPEKPSISAEAQKRIRAFVTEVEAAQRSHGVEIGIDGGILSLKDTKRKGPWLASDGDIYGDDDAAFFCTKGGAKMFCEKNLAFEDFAGWDS